MTLVFMMESTYQDLADRALKLLQNSQHYRIIILLIGAPGSGKTTVAQRVVDILNKKFIDEGHSLEGFTKKVDLSSNNNLPKYDTNSTIDYEDENYTPTVQISDNDTIIRGRGGDDTAIKISSKVDHTQQDTFAQVIPMDGFHLPRSILKKFKDPEHASKRRGSPFTFDSSLVVKLVENLNETLQIEVEDNLDPLTIIQNQLPNIYIPSFDHAEHDPRQFGSKINSSSRILIMEGLYLLLDQPVWRDIAKTLNSKVEVEENTNIEELIAKNDRNARIKDIPIEQGKTSEFWKILIDDSKILYRVGKRHLKAGIVTTLEEGEERVKINDLPNGQRVYSQSFKSDLNIISIDDVKEC